MECSFFLGHNDSHNSMCISQAAAKGAKRIIGVDKSPSKEDLGKKFAGDNFEFVNPDKHPDKSVDEILVDKSGSGGVAYCFEAVGSIGTMEASVRSNGANSFEAVCNASAARLIDKNLID